MTPKRRPCKKVGAFCAPGVPTITTRPAKILPPPLYLVLQRTIRHQTKRKTRKILPQSVKHSTIPVKMQKIRKISA
jgi:hypothetical protein